MTGQMSIFDWMPSALPEYEVGEYVTITGAIIPHIMRPSYIGKKILIDVSTQHMTLYQVGILEKYIPHEGCYRSVVFTGERQRKLITHYPGREIYECRPWDFERVMKNHESEQEQKQQRWQAIKH